MMNDDFNTQVQCEEFYEGEEVRGDFQPEPAEEQPYDGGGWAGDGSGTDDFADWNANEVDDYRDE